MHARVTLRAMLAGAYTPGKGSHARQFKGKGKRGVVPGPPPWELGVGSQHHPGIVYCSENIRAYGGGQDTHRIVAPLIIRMILISEYIADRTVTKSNVQSSNVN